MTRRGVFRGSPGLRFALLAALALAGLVSGCSTGTGVYHRVERGQTAYRIAQAYGIEPRALLESNAIADPRALRTGQLLWIPGATRTRTVPPREDFPETSSRLSGKRLVMPLRGPVSSGFGNRNGRKHEGVDILAPEGALVRAAGYGVVLYAGDGLRGYGNAIVLDHGDGVTTLYGHLKNIRVQSGDIVAAGSVIGAVGDTGNATTAHLHFELRLEGEGVDPEPYCEKAEDPR
ncbi:MAG: M23-like protein peptidase [Deltaproteobacteria bacterium CSP1-8]|nr:MAG: M23-like protein peptidase [Deltaproteobacteria bacterium CSP1-8]